MQSVKSNPQVWVPVIALVVQTFLTMLVSLGLASFSSDQQTAIMDFVDAALKLGVLILPWAGAAVAMRKLSTSYEEPKAQDGEPLVRQSEAVEIGRAMASRAMASRGMVQNPAEEEFGRGSGLGIDEHD